LVGLSRASLTVGAIIGSVEIVDCVPFTSSIGEELRRAGAFFGDMRGVTEFAWILTTPERLAQPIPYRGALGLFQVTVDVG
jgi:hypothetical protein